MATETISKTWYLNPLCWLDEEDLLNRPDAVELLRDLLVSRPTELNAFLRLFLHSCRNLDETQLLLTSRQNEAVRLAREAVRAGQHPTRYIADRLGVTPRAIQRLLNRAEVRIVESDMFAFSSEFHVYLNNNEHKNAWRPNEKQIKRQMTRMKTTCAACGRDINGRFALCFECGVRFGHTREEWNESKRQGEPAPARWLLPEVRRLQRQLRRDAINELYKHGDYDIEEYENVLLRRAS